MELTFAKCEQVLSTLPIGYYTGRRIAVKLDENEETSFYSPVEDSIIVSYKIIAHRMEHISEGSNEEEAIRSMLYHEVSHAILTPEKLRPNTAINIFEDERIESVLRNYYHGVDFRKQLYDIHGGHAPEAKNTEQAFFNAVRFGLGTAKIQAEINRLIKKYAKMNRNTPEWNSSTGICCDNYREDINALYRMIDKDFPKNPEEYNDPEGKGECRQMDGLGEGQSEQGEEGENEGNGFSLSEDENASDTARKLSMTMKELKRMVSASLGTKPENLSQEQKKKLDEFQKTAELIIGNFNKKNSGGSGINAYSGVFNPRAVARKDYRFFERSMTTQGNNKFGTCHLNLIIDCSGSFCYNEDITNGILTVLTEIERKNRNFSLDVAFINHEFHPCKTVRDRHIDTWGGNAIPADMKEILIGMQKRNTCNYNIILFDGDALCNNDDLRGINDKIKRFGVFDMKQTTLITDPDNERYLGNGFTSTKVVVTKRYADELIRHITNALTVAFG